MEIVGAGLGGVVGALLDSLASELFYGEGNLKLKPQLQFQLGLLERELRLILAVSEHIDSLEEPSEYLNRWANEGRNVVRSVEDMIDTFMKTSRILKRYGLCFSDLFLELMLSFKIKRRMLRIDTFSKRSKVLFGESRPMFSIPTLLRLEPVKPGIAIGDLLWIRNQIFNVRKDWGGRECEVTTSREVNVKSETTTIISSFLEQVNLVLSQKFLFDQFAIREVKQVKEDILCDLLKDMEAVRELDERENVWMEWVREICIPANEFLTSFVSKRQQQIKGWAKLKAPTFLRADLELKTKMKRVRSRIQYAYGRRWIYGMGLSDEREGLKPSSSRAFELESIWRDLRLMRALLKDVEGMEDQSKRVEVWLKQMGDLASKVDALNTCIQSHPEKIKGGLTRPLLLLKELKLLFLIAEKIEEISSEFHAMSERKTTYDIGTFEGKRGHCSRVQDLQGTAASMSHHTIVEDDDDNLEEAQPGSSQQHTKTRRYMGEGEIEEEVKSIAAESSRMNALIDTRPSTSASVERSYSRDSSVERSLHQNEKRRDIKEVESMGRELKLIYAFLKDVEAIEEPDAILKFWEEEMRDIAHEADDIIYTSELRYTISMIKRNRIKSIFNRLASILKIPKADSKVVRKISTIKKKTQGFTERRIVYGIEHVEASNSMTKGINQRRRRPPPQYSEKSDISLNLTKLPSKLKRCLHYFLLFPEDFDIPARRLTTLWVAEGFLRGRGDESPEHLAEQYLQELIDQNMVQVTKTKQNGKVRTCRLPDAWRKLLSEANTASKSSSSIHSNYWIVDHYSNTDASFNHIHGDDTDTSTLKQFYRKSLSFLSFDVREGSQPGEEVGNFLDRCISCRCFLLLRVLDLEHVFRPQLPKVLNEMALLRYLGLRWTYLESLPSSISNLLKLQTLDVKHTYISTLPPSIWKMQRLRHLYLSESYRSRFRPRRSGASLTDLQTLWGAFVDEKSPVRGGLDTLVNLRKLGVACRCMSNQDAMTRQLEAVAYWIHGLRQLQSLRLKSHDENNQPWDLHLHSFLDHKNLSSVYLLGRIKTPSVISEFPENLIELTLSASALTEDPMQRLVNLKKLRILQLFSESYVGEKMCCPQNSFLELQVLKLWKLKKLKDWIVEEGALSQLSFLEVRSCPLLHKLPDGLQHVKNQIHE